MKVEKVIAKSGGKVVGEGDVNLFESVQEAVDAMTAERVLTLINRQIKIDKTNSLREAATRGTTIPKVIRDRLMAIADAGVRAEVMKHMGITEEMLAAKKDK